MSTQPPVQGAAVGLAEEADLEELIRQKEEAAAERDEQVEQIMALRGEVSCFAAERIGSCFSGSAFQAGWSRGST